MIAKTISHYKILEKLGEGGMGVVYKAEDTKLKRTVALKFLSPQALGSDEDKARFIHEAQAAASLSHPNICTVHEIDRHEGRDFIAMECVEGQSLRDRIASGPLKLGDAVNLAIQIAEGLQEAHERGIVHRDIKPANVMITAKGTVKIMDFGLAKAGGRTVLTKTGTTLGTVAYMSPEQARGEAVDSRTDIWSLGAILYEMIGGRKPFKGDYEPAIVYSILNEKHEPLTAIRTGVPVELERVVDKALEKKAEERYQSGEELLVDLRKVARSLEGARAERPISHRTTSGVSEGGDGRRGGRFYRPAGVAVIVILLALAGIEVIPSFFSKEPDDAIDSIAVLPLENISGDAAEDYFVDGMHEALITDLSKIKSLKVISRTSAMRYKGTDKSISEIADELDVDALVEGSVMRVGDQVRITTQLIHGPTDGHLWAESYDREVEDVLNLISEVARSIAGEIHVTLSQQEEERLSKARPVDPLAHDLFLKGRHFWSTLTWQGLSEALEYFEDAVRVDPEFALSWAHLGVTHAMMGAFAITPVTEAIEKAEAAAVRAIELDDQLSDAHTSLGYVRLYEWDWPGAAVEFRRALELNPNDAFALHGYGDYLTVIGRPEEGLQEIVKACDCDPFSPITYIPVVSHLIIVRRYDEAIQEALAALARDPGGAGNYNLSKAYWYNGMYEESLQALWKSGWGRDAELKSAMEEAYAESGPQAAMLAAAKLLDARSESERVDPLDLAIFYSAAGEVDATFEWLERACEERSPLLWHFLAGPEADLLKGDPRLDSLLRRMNLTHLAH